MAISNFLPSNETNGNHPICYHRVAQTNYWSVQSDFNTEKCGKITARHGRLVVVGCAILKRNFNTKK